MDELVRINAQLSWRTWLSKSKNWVAACDALKLSVQGTTFEELLHTISEATNTLMLDLWQDGALDTFLSKHGWSVQSAISPEAEPRFDVPFQVELSANAPS